MAERWNSDAIEARGIEDRRPLRNRDNLAVDRQLDLRLSNCLDATSVGAHAILVGCLKQTFPGQRRRTVCSSTTSGKCLRMEAMGTGTTCPKPANGCHLHRCRQFIEQLHVTFGASSFGPAFQQLDHLLRAHAAWYALAAGFVAIEARRIERHVKHAAVFGANHDRARSHHGARGGYCIPIQWKARHRSRQVSQTTDRRARIPAAAFHREFRQRIRR